VKQEGVMFQSSVRINVGPNWLKEEHGVGNKVFQSSVRINVGPNHKKGQSLPCQLAGFNPP